MQEKQEHWEDIYSARDDAALTWFEERPLLSLELIGKYARPGDPIIDVGGGASRLAESLLDAGLGPISVLDISQSALEASRKRLGNRADRVEWIVADITNWMPNRRYRLWHDRAVFHFLTEHEDRAAYARILHRALDPDGVVIIATFAEDGPEKCSGLPVARYSPESLARTLEHLVPGGFHPIESRRHVHVTPKGNHQAFQFSVLRRKAE